MGQSPSVGSIFSAAFSLSLTKKERCKLSNWVESGYPKIVIRDTHSSSHTQAQGVDFQVEELVFSIHIIFLYIEHNGFIVSRHNTMIDWVCAMQRFTQSIDSGLNWAVQNIAAEIGPSQRRWSTCCSLSCEQIPHYSGVKWGCRQTPQPLGRARPVLGPESTGFIGGPTQFKWLEPRKTAWEKSLKHTTWPLKVNGKLTAGWDRILIVLQRVVPIGQE